MKKIFCTTILLLVLTCQVSGQTIGALRQKIVAIMATRKATVGVAVAGIETGDTLSICNQYYPMQSVYKFPIALAILHEVDLGKRSLSQQIYISKSDLRLNTWSPIRDAYPAGNISLTLAALIRYTVAESDNNGCDILLKLIGGPEKVNAYVHQLGIRDMYIKASEAEMHRTWEVQFTNRATPMATITLLKLFYNRKLLAEKTHKFLWQIMTSTSTGKNSIKGLLPAGTAVAHKTGTSDTNKEGITAAVNDLGIITLPNGQHFAICIFVSNSRETLATNERIIADISRVVWDYFLRNGK